jgi:4-diphosphocytidyl-2-C-methyl-D-erythritol kinase
MTVAAGALVEKAPAKVNLTLRVVGRRSDGYHEIESLVAFSAVADVLSLAPGPTLSLRVSGPTGPASGDLQDNLVLKAAHALAARIKGLKLGRFALSKRLPVAAGLGGGSSDAAAALRLLARANRIAGNDPHLVAAASATGADVPVCLDPRPRQMGGIGEILSDPLDLPRLPAVLVNPGVALATKDVFAALRPQPLSSSNPVPVSAITSVETLLAALAKSGNDLESAAVKLQPVIAGVLAELNRLPACRLARMSGSGATCFGLFESFLSAAAAARSLHRKHPSWWIRATTLGG